MVSLKAAGKYASMCVRGRSEKDKERNQCLVILITGALQNVRVTREATDKDNNNNHILIKGRVEEKQEEKPPT